jgi:hypothetical protein
MAGVKHTKTLVSPDSGAEDKVYGEDWNAEHTLSDVAAQADLDAVSNAVSVVSAAVVTEAGSRSTKDDALSQAISVVSQAVSVLSNTNSAEHAALSGRITSVGGLAGGGSVTSDELSAAGAGLSVRVDSVANAVSVVSQALSVGDAALSARVDSAANAKSVLSQAVSVADAALSVRADSVANAVSVVSQALSVTNASLSNLISAHNVLSNRVSANSGTGGAASVTSNELSIAAAGLSARTDSVANAVSVVSNAVSALSQANSVDHAALSARITSVANAGGGGSVTSNELSAVSARLPVWRRVTGSNFQATAVLSNVSGMSWTVSAGEYYNFKICVIWQSGAVTNGIGLALTFPAMTSFAAGVNIGGGAAGNTHYHGGTITEAGSGSAIIAVSAQTSTAQYHAVLEGAFLVSTTGTLQLQYRSEAANISSHVLRGTNGWVVKAQ